MVLNFSVNYVAVLVATIAAYFVGSMWHGPLFGKHWMRLMKIQMPKRMTPQFKKMMWKSMILGFFITLLSAWALAVLLESLGATHLVPALFVGVIIWLGFLMPMMFAGYNWEGKNFELFMMNATYRLVEVLILAAAYGAWPN
jgi:hypothetical protein